MTRWQMMKTAGVFLFAVLYGASPIDAIPDAIPLFGILDDLGVGGIALVLGVWWWRRSKALTEDTPADEADVMTG